MDRRFFLRDQTRPLHDRLDSQIGAFNVVADYLAYLRGMARFRISVEAWLDGVAAPDAVWRPRRIGSLIRSDLVDVGLPTPDAEPFSVPGDTPSHVLGALYVVEGAALGGQVLARRAVTLGFTASFGARHLSDAEQGIASWRGFLAALDRCETFEPRSALIAANAMFEAATQMFAPPISAPHCRMPGKNVFDDPERLEHRPVVG